jgi:hypothetical protein
MSFALADYGAVFSTRPLGAKLRDEALARCAGKDFTISFAGVQSISYSFADEFLGPIMLSSDRPRLDEVPPQLHRIILGALERRGLRTDEHELFGSSVCA